MAKIKKSRGARPRNGRDRKAYTVGVELPDGKKLIATRIGLTEAKGIGSVDCTVFDDKKSAQSSAEKIAAGYKKYKGVEVKPYIGRPWQGGEDNQPDENLLKAKPAAQRSQSLKSTNVAKPRGEAAAPRTGANAQSRKAAPAAQKAATAFTVKAGRTTRTFATKAEAQEFARQCKNRNVSVTPSTRKPTHRIVSFTAKK